MKNIIDNLAIIPARAGSKGIKHKNMRKILEKPLISYSIEFALNHKEIDLVVVSTDDPDIIELSKSYDVLVIERPKELSNDQSLVIDAVRYTLYELEKKHFSISQLFLLEPTSPLRLDEDLTKAIDLMKYEDVDSVATFSKSQISPNRLWRYIQNDEVMKPYIDNSVAWLPRQLQPEAYELNGLIYGLKTSTLKQNPNEISMLQGKMRPIIINDRKIIDIDYIEDLALVETLMRLNMKEQLCLEDV